MAEILVVDDDAAVRESLTAVLEASGHLVDQAADGEQALRAVDASLPDLILLDLAMPVMSGWHVLEELHGRDLRRRTRVLLMSGQFEPSEVARRAPWDRFIAKPFDVDELVQIVEDVLAQDPADLYVRRARTDDLARLLREVDDVIG
jgi:CheY-like chemotaxis protein